MPEVTIPWRLEYRPHKAEIDYVEAVKNMWRYEEEGDMGKARLIFDFLFDNMTGTKRLLLLPFILKYGPKNS